MIKEYIEAGIPVMYIQAEEPERIKNFIPKTKHEFFGEWDGVTGLDLKIGNVSYKSTLGGNSLDECLQYLSNHKKSHFCIFHNIDLYYSPEVHYEHLNRLKQTKHTIVCTGQSIPKIPNIMTFNLPQPSVDEYYQEFNCLLKPKTKKVKKFLNDCAKVSIGMRITDAVNCLRLSETSQDFLNNKHRFIFSDVLEVQFSDYTFKDVGGLFNIKQWIQDRKFLFTEDMDIEAPKGIILKGVSGTGKSLLAKSIANEYNIPLVQFDITRVYDQYVGVSEERFRDTLSVIEQLSPCVLRLEELNRIVTKTDNNPAVNNIISIFLTWLQEHNKKIFTIATVNHAETLPEELIRKGRFSKIFDIQMPNKEEREDIFKVHFRKRGLNIKTDRIAEQERTGAEIEAFINDVMIDCYNKGKEPKEKDFKNGD